MVIKTTMSDHLPYVSVAFTKRTRDKYWLGCRKSKPCIVGGKVNWYGPYGKQYGNSPKFFFKKNYYIFQ